MTRFTALQDWGECLFDLALCEFAKRQLNFLLFGWLKTTTCPSRDCPVVHRDCVITMTFLGDMGQVICQHESRELADAKLSDLFPLNGEFRVSLITVPNEPVLSEVFRIHPSAVINDGNER